VSATVLAVTSSASAPATETPKRGAIAGAIALGAHVVIFLAAFLAGRLTSAGNGGGMQDLAAVSGTLFGGETLLAIACLVVASILFRRDLRYTGVGIMAGWFAGLIVLAILVLV
jgi:hypothetical protein